MCLFWLLPVVAVVVPQLQAVRVALVGLARVVTVHLLMFLVVATVARRFFR
jgi:hypothetical protein